MKTNGNERALDGRASLELEVEAEPFAGCPISMWSRMDGQNPRC